MKQYQIQLQRTHQFFSIIINFHLWKWVKDGKYSSHRTSTKYYGLVFSLNIFYTELYIVIAPFKKTIDE